MKAQNVVAIFGYNNTRIYDVKKIKALVKAKYNAEILLVRETITSQDHEVSPYCFLFSPDDIKIVSPLLEYLESNNLHLLGCLPFSDKGVIGAAAVAKELNLFGDDVITAEAMLDKHKFRILEKSLHLPAATYKKPFFYIVHSQEEVINVLNTHSSFFIKPVAEGNSRGCMKITNPMELQQWLIDYSSSLSKGVICEEILADGNEFSFDGVNNQYWITQKFTTQGKYRAEYQHIVPAPLADAEDVRIKSVLEPLLADLGSNGGAFHHEFFILEDQKLASVEPNRRPAGMHIWDLAAWSFEGFRPYEEWLDVCTNTTTNKKELKRTCYSGIRGVISKIDGVLSSIDEVSIRREMDKLFGSQNYQLSLLKPNGSAVKQTPKDNSDFLAYVMLKNASYQKLINQLEVAERIVLFHSEIQV